MSENNGKGRIAIKFGSGPAAKSSPRPNPPSSLGKRSRSRPWGGDESDSESDHPDGTHEKITGFGASGAESANKLRPEKKDYVIARQPNRDWKAEARGSQPKRGKQASAAAGQTTNTVEREPADQDKGIQWGLTIPKKKTQEVEDEPVPDGVAKDVDGADKVVEEPRTADDEAIDALLGKEKDKPQLTIPSRNEDSAYANAVATAGEAPTLADYEAMPVEEFGAALLRGMGWDGKDRGPKKKEVVRRPNRLGLGAKELKDAEELGAWNQSGAKKNGLRDKRPPKLSDYRREEEKRREARKKDSYRNEEDHDRRRERHSKDHRDYNDSGRHHNYDRDRRR